MVLEFRNALRMGGREHLHMHVGNLQSELFGDQFFAAQAVATSDIFRLLTHVNIASGTILLTGGGMA